MKKCTAPGSDITQPKGKGTTLASKNSVIPSKPTVNTNSAVNSKGKITPPMLPGTMKGKRGK